MNGACVRVSRVATGEPYRPEIAMSDRALTNAKKLRDELLGRKKELQQELSAVDTRLDRIEAFIAEWHTYATGDAAEINEPVDTTSKNKKPASRRVVKRATGNTPKEKVAEAAIEIIHERGEPVSRSELYQALVARGMKIEGVDPEMVLSTMLWRMKHRVARLKSGGYWPADEVNEAAEYDPSNPASADPASTRGGATPDKS